MKKRRVVIFDCDGVMFDSRQSNINFYNHILAHFGLPPMSDMDISYVHMHTADESVRRIFQGTHYTQEAREYRKTLDYTPFISDMIIEPGLIALLKRLKPGFGLAVATNRSNTIGNVLSSNGLDQYFDIVISSLDVKRPKPHPESIYRILDFFNVEPSMAIYVGDSMVDYDTAKAAEVSFISFKNTELRALHHADCMEDIFKIIEDRL